MRDAQANGVDGDAAGHQPLGVSLRAAGPGHHPLSASGAVKGAGQAAVENIIAARESGGPYLDLYDFCDRIDRRLVNRRAVEALVRAGAFDALDATARRLLANVQRAMDAAEQNAARRAAPARRGLFGDLGSAPQAGGRRRAGARVAAGAAAGTKHRRLHEEKAALGFYLSGHLFTAARARTAPLRQDAPGRPRRASSRARTAAPR